MSTGKKEGESTTKKCNVDDTTSPQIECPPCALRDSTLPVCGLTSEQRPGTVHRGQHGGARLPTVTKTSRVVRQNRASQLRRQRSRQKSEGTRTADKKSQSSGSSDYEFSEDDAGDPAADPRQLQRFFAMLDAPAKKFRTSNSSSDSVAQTRPTDTAMTTPTDNVDEKSQTVVSSILDISHLRELMTENERQRNLLRGRITGLARVMTAGTAVDGAGYPGSTANTAPNIAPNLAPNLAPNPAPNTAPNLAPNTAPNLAPNLTPNLAPNTAPSIAPNLAPNLVPNQAPNLAPNIATNIAPNLVPNLAPNLASNLVPILEPILATNPTTNFASSQYPAQNLAQNPVQNLAQNPVQNPAQNLTQNPAQIPAPKVVQNLADNPAMQPAKNLAPNLATQAQQPQGGSSASIEISSASGSLDTDADADTDNSSGAVQKSTWKRHGGVDRSSQTLTPNHPRRSPSRLPTKASQAAKYTFEDQRIRALAEQLTVAAEECADLRLEREATRRQMEAVKFDMRIATVEAQERRTELTQARRELEIREERIRQLTEVNTRSEKEAGNLRSQLVDLRLQLESTENSIQAELARSQRYRAQLANLEAQLDSRMHELTSVTNALIEKRRAEEDLLARVQQLQKGLAGSDETVRRLTQQLAAEQTKVRDIHPETGNQEPPRCTGAATQTPAVVSPDRSTSKVPLPRQSPSNQLVERMAELDARVARLLTQACEGVGWRRELEPMGLREQQQQQEQHQLREDSSPPRSEFVLTSTPRSEIQSRISQLEQSNTELLRDVCTLRAVCSDLMDARSDSRVENVQPQVRNESPPANHKRHPQQPSLQLELSGYLFEVDTLRAMIHRQLSLRPGDSDPPRLPDELRSQQQALNRRWLAVQTRFGRPPDFGRESSPGAYRDFYLRRTAAGSYRRAAQTSSPSFAAALLDSMRPLSPPETGVRQCGCQHSVK